MDNVPISAFISYSRADSALIDRIEADLRSYGFDVWVDRQHLEGGADWARHIERQILSCSVLIVALSPDAVTSSWVRREITYALQADKQIIPVVVRTIDRAPIEIVEKQRIDLDVDYMRGMQELRVSLLKLQTIAPPPRMPHPLQPLLTIPDTSDPLKGLVQIPPAPPAPNPDLNALFMQVQASVARDNLDLAEALLSQLVQQQADFGYGMAAEELERVRQMLAPKQVERLRKMANEAHAKGAWGQEVGALGALTERLPDDIQLRERLRFAEACQKWAWLYDNAMAFAQSGDLAAATIVLNQLWEKAPYFGDPAQIAPKGITPPDSTAVIAMALSACPACGTHNAPGMRYCTRCGSRLPLQTQQTTTCEACGADAVDTWGICRNCGRRSTNTPSW